MIRRTARLPQNPLSPLRRHLPRLAAFVSALVFTLVLFQGVAGLAAPEHAGQMLVKVQADAAHG